MNAAKLEERMENLEKVVEPLRGLPDRMTRVEVQVLQLRTEMRGEFSAIRRDMATRKDLARMGRGLRRQMQGLHGKMLDLHEDLHTKMLALHEDLHTRMLVLHEDLHTRMLVLHEALVERLKILGEARPSARATRSRKGPGKKP